MGVLGTIGGWAKNLYAPHTIGESNEGALDFIPGIGDARAQDRANEANIKLDGVNRAWQERMSNSAYQRAMADMKKAGLNPLLAYQQGGASVPSTSAATVGAASKTGLASASIAAYTGIKGVQSQAQQANTAEAQSQSSISLNTATAAKTIADTKLTQAETALKQRELKGKGVKNTLDLKGGELINDFLEKAKSTLQNSAKPLMVTPAQQKDMENKIKEMKKFRH